MAALAPQDRHRVAAVRRFNRFYTQHLGVLRQDWLDSPFSLTEARVLYEIRQRGRSTATDIGRDLGLDAGYLSRIVRRFHKAGLIRRQVSADDARQSFLSITARGSRAFAPLENRTERQVGAVLDKLRAPERDTLISAMRTVETLIAAKEPAGAPILRPPKPGDLGWIVMRHAEIYLEEYGWAAEFEGICAQIVADFAKNYDATCERCWIAELDGRNVGSVFLVKDSESVARLRLLLVEPSARGLGLGRRLTDEAVRFARDCGYRRVTLWTHGNLTAARHVYKNAGFTLTSSERKTSFGQPVVSEHWDLTL